jgi:putative DNA primase/helicase
MSIAPDLSAIPPFLTKHPRWLGWKTEIRKDKLTKVPKSWKNFNAKSTDPKTWAPFADIAGIVRLQPTLWDGIGVTFGDLGDGEYLGGIDLDSCLDAEGKIADWARPLVEALPTYREVSPSAGGLKSFFRCSGGDVNALHKAFGLQQGTWGCRRGVGGNGQDHGPAIEVYFSGRFFTVTGKRCPDSVADVALLDRTALLHVAELVQQATSANGSGNGKDDSRSATAFRRGAKLIREGKTYDEMCQALRDHPDTADWYKEKGEAADGRELRRIWDKVTNRPQISVIAGRRHEAADAGIAALHGRSIYQRGPEIVRCTALPAKNSRGTITSVPGIVPICQSYLERALGLAADWFRPNKSGELRRIDPPHDVSAQILAMQGQWPFPLLTGVIGTPTMRHDGSLLLAEGYDEQSGYYLLNPPRMPPIDESPTKDKAQRALDYLKALLADFPFVDNPSRSVALSAMMTPVLRPAMAVAPCHAVTAPEAGTGKSYLLDIAAMVATGDLCPVVSLTRGDARECEKRLIGCVISGQPIIALDNLSVPLEGDFLCQLTERPRLLPRALGSSDMDRVIPNSFTVFANGQNLSVAEDMAARRTIMAMLDANTDDTTKRTFSSPSPIERVAAARGNYVAAILTIARAYIAAGCPNLKYLPSYGDWCRCVRSPLVWLGEADPADTMATIRETDPMRAQRARVFTEWKEALGARNAKSPSLPADGYQVKELLEKSNQVPALREVFLEIAAGRQTPPEIDPRYLGNWLRKAKDIRFGGLKLVCNKSADPYRPRWFLETYK